MKFRVGDIVRCVNGNHKLIRGQDYTITVITTYCGANYLNVKECIGYFDFVRFELVFRRGTETAVEIV